MIELEPIMKAAVTFGIWDRAWRKVKYPEYPQIGRFEADYFRPELWRPEYGNPAFHRMLPQDAFWATRIIAEFTDEMVSELVKIGRITDPEAEKYLIETLIKRRDKIIQHYLPQICALDNFVISGNRLQFRDLGEKHGIYRSPEYSAEWFTYDNGSDQLKSLISGIHSSENFLEIPQNDAEFLMVRIAVDFAGADAKNSIDVYLRNSQSPKTLVGIERR
jgi:hypothetical protein